jgi:AcrR family transcriptional regulator
MAKANIYRYFETREALLLELLWDEWQSWFTDFQKDWSRVSANKKSFETLIKTLASSISKRELLCNLTSALPSVLERNLSPEILKEFKYRSLDFFGAVAQHLELCSNDLTAAKYAIFLQDTVSLIVGLYPFAHPNNVVEKVLADPQLKFFRRDFGAELERYMRSLAFDQRQKAGK